MCNRPEVSWLDSADKLLEEWVGQRRSITSLEFKMELRKRLGEDVNVVQRDVSEFLRSEFGHGVSGYDEDFNGVFFVYGWVGFPSDPVCDAAKGDLVSCVG